MEVEGYSAYRVASLYVSRDSVIQKISTLRGDLRRAGIKLDDWEPPTTHTSDQGKSQTG